MSLTHDFTYRGHDLKRHYTVDQKWAVRCYVTLEQTGSRLLVFEQAEKLAVALAKLRHRIDRHLENPRAEYTRALATGVEFL